METCRGTRKSKLALLRNRNGQFAIEAVLLTAVLIGGFVATTGIIKEKGYISKLFEGPIRSLGNMTAFGTFKQACEGLGSNKKKQTLSHCHPNSVTRALSSKPQ